MGVGHIRLLGEVKWLHRPRQSASETPVGRVDLLGEFLEPEPEGHGDDYRGWLWSTRGQGRCDEDQPEHRKETGLKSVG